MQYFWEMKGTEMLILQVSIIIGLMIGAFFTATLHKYKDKKFGVVVGVEVWAVLQFTPVVLRLVDWFPENGTSAGVLHSPSRSSDV